MLIQVGNKKWEFIRGKPKDFPNGSRSEYAYCDNPKNKNKQIVIDPNLDGQFELEIVLHELLHASDWSKSEEWVTEIAHQLSVILYKLGYRKMDEEKV